MAMQYESPAELKMPYNISCKGYIYITTNIKTLLFIQAF